MNDIEKKANDFSQTPWRIKINERNEVVAFISSDASNAEFALTVVADRWVYKDALEDQQIVRQR